MRRARSTTRVALLILAVAVTAPRADVRFPYLKVSLNPAQTVTVVDVDSVPADGLCVVYTSLDETLDDAPYAPRHCVAFDEAIRTYVDDWDTIPSGHTYDVHAELYPPGRDDVTRTNVVRIVRK
jgi:hypothetical protein